MIKVLVITGIVIFILLVTVLCCAICAINADEGEGDYGMEDVPDVR